MVIVPLCLAEVAPKRYSKLYGTLYQISVGSGMIFAQSLSLVFAKPFDWRYELVVAVSIGLVLLLCGLFVGGDKHEEKADGEDEETPLIQRASRSSSRPVRSDADRMESRQ